MKSKDKLTKREQNLLNCFRDIESRHVRDALLLLIMEASVGTFTKKADKTPLKTLLRPIC